MLHSNGGIQGVWLAKIGSKLNLRGILSDTTHVCTVC